MKSTRAPGFEDALRQLVAIPSISSTQTNIDQGNLDVVQRLANWLEALDFAVEIHTLDAQRGKANLYAVLGPDQPGGVLCRRVTYGE